MVSSDHVPTAASRLKRALTSEAVRSAGAASVVVAFGLALRLRRPDIFLQDDMLMQYLPASRDVARALSHGEWPLLTPSCWFGAALAGEYQHAVFSPFELALNTLVWTLGLSLANTATVLVLVHYSILAAGAFRLARAYGCTAIAATVVAVIGSLNGWMMNWGAVNWYPALTSFSWLPWFWLSLLQLDRAPALRFWRVSVTGLLLFSILSAGWLFTVAMAALVTLWFVLAHRPARLLRALALSASVWVIGLALASPALTMLAHYGSATVRGEQGLTINRGMIVALEGLLGMALPAYRTNWNGFFDSGLRRSVELAGGLVPCVCAALVAFHGHRKRATEERALAVLIGVVAVLMTSPAIEGLRFGFRWLPLFHLALALLGMRAWSRDLVAPRWIALTTLAVTTLVWARALLLNLDPGTQSMQLGGWLVGLAGVWLLASFVVRSPTWSAVPMLAFILGSFWVTYRIVPPNTEVNRWALSGDPRDIAPLDPGVRYLSLWEWNDLLRPGEGPAGPDWVLETGGLRVGYTALFSGASVLHGYSPVGELALTRLLEFNIHAENPGGYPARALREASLGGGFLQLAAVDGLIVPARYERERADLERAGWRHVASVEQGEVLHRGGPPSPRVRSVGEALVVPSLPAALALLVSRSPEATPSILVDEKMGDGVVRRYADAKVSLKAEERLRSRAEVDVPAGDNPGLVVFSRPWLPGWKAKVGDRKLRVMRYDGFFTAVRVPPGTRGTLELRYFPGPLASALWVAGVCLLACLAASVWQVRHRLRIRAGPG
jgi:hypothetical protein